VLGGAALMVIVGREVAADCPSFGASPRRHDVTRHDLKAVVKIGIRIATIHVTNV
jgi:hypothetical protein